ncbi:hypothetical protein KEM48_000171 [Puccinia striiformis f. sp. tritici PST-130]|nr:hypothetical protein KEM48_000171 [Puccinia striiformis f. sp. tritici PST-130]
MDQLDQLMQEHGRAAPAIQIRHIALTRDEDSIIMTTLELISKIRGYADQFRLADLHKAKYHPTLEAIPAHFYGTEPQNFPAAEKIVEEIEDIADQINDLVNLFSLPNDQNHLPTKRVKNHRCKLTRLKMLDMMEYLVEFLDNYNLLLILSTRLDSETAVYGWDKIVYDAHDLRDYLDDLMKWCRLSDLGVLQDQWREMAERTEDLFEYLGELPLSHVDLHSQILQDSFLDSTLFFPDVFESFIYSIEYAQDAIREPDVEPEESFVQFFGRCIKILNDNLEHQALNPAPHQHQSYHEFWNGIQHGKSNSMQLSTVSKLHTETRIRDFQLGQLTALMFTFSQHGKLLSRESLRIFLSFRPPLFCFSL